MYICGDILGSNLRRCDHEEMLFKTCVKKALDCLCKRIKPYFCL